MFDIDRWTEIWVTITRNKTRSLMTCFGVFWGILMLVLLLGTGSGFKNAMFKSVNGFATNSLFFYADRTSEPYQGIQQGANWNMRNRDIDAIIRDVPSVQDISPILWGNRSEKNIVYGIMTGTFNVKGIYPAYFNIDTQDLYYGRLLNEIDMREKRKVCLIGTKINEVLFHNEDPCGKYIRVNGLYYQVVGVVNQRASGLNLGGRGEETVFIPFNTMQQTLNQGDILHFLALSVKPGYPIETTIEPGQEYHEDAKSDRTDRSSGDRRSQYRRTIQDIQSTVYRYRHLGLAGRHGYLAIGYYWYQQYHDGNGKRAHEGDRRTKGFGSQAFRHHLASHERELGADCLGGLTGIKRRSLPLGFVG